MPTVVLESMDIPGLGSFTAYKSGWVRMCFLDRSVLDFHCPELAVVKQPSLKVDRFTELDPHMCRLMLPNGRYEMFSVTSPLQFAWCVLCVFMPVCVCIWVCVDVYACVCVYGCVLMCMCMHVCVDVYVYACVCVYGCVMCVCMCVYGCVLMCMCMHVCVCMGVCLCVCVRYCLP